MAYTLQELVEHFDLQAHPEGGYFRETYRSQASLPAQQLPGDFPDRRHISTCIYFLLTADNFSAFHRIRQDEIWHFYYGAPLTLHLLTQDGAYQKHHIGMDIHQGAIPQFIVPGGAWFAAEVAQPGAFSFIGCTVAPGFDFADFELAQAAELIQVYPAQAELINRLTRQ